MKHRSSKGRRRGRVWEVYWQVGEKRHLVQETSYNQVIRRMDMLGALPWVTKSGYRELLR